MISAPLGGMKVLVTRQMEQKDALCQFILQAGGEPIIYPLLSIEPIAFDWPLIEAGDALIFVSQNAVHCTMAHQCSDLIDRAIPVYTPGPKTAAQLSRHGFLPKYPEGQEYNSDALLSLLNHQKQTRYIIFSGEKGRDYLPNALKAKGNTVVMVPVYCVNIPESLSPITTVLIQKPDVILMTSGKSLEHFVRLLQDAQIGLDWTLLVVSERIQKLAYDYGFRQIIMSYNATDEAILDCLKRYQVERKYA